MMKVGVLLFENFETLDVFGPVEILGRLTEEYQIYYYSLVGGLVTNQHGIKIMSERLLDGASALDIFLLPGGSGTRVEVHNRELISAIQRQSQISKYVLTVCTGSALLAMTGLLDHKKATTNKRAYDWVISLNKEVEWVKQARWVVDDKYYTSSGVSAGMDMTLGFLSDRHGIEFARKVAFQIEYTWTEDRSYDPFCNQ